MPYVERLTQILSPRDWAIIETINRFRLASGAQLERLHFHDLAGRSRAVVRGRVLKRLTDVRVLLPYERRIGSSWRGSANLVYTLDSAGQRLVRLRTNRETPDLSARRPRQPGERFVAHTLAVSELYVDVVEHSWTQQFELETFEAEPAWPNGLGGWVKPDAYLKLRRGTVTDYWWYEADLATESLPTIARKLRAYRDFAARGQLGPDGVVPRVVIGVPTEARQWAIQREVNQLPDPADLMFRVVQLLDVAGTIIQELVS
jgi:hypothetical protein